MQKSPGPLNLVRRRDVVGWKYNTKASWPKAEESGVGQRACCHARRLPASIVWNVFGRRLPAIKRLLKMTGLGKRDQRQNNGKRPRQSDALPGARQLSQKHWSKLQANRNQ